MPPLLFFTAVLTVFSPGIFLACISNYICCKTGIGLLWHASTIGYNKRVSSRKRIFLFIFLQKEIVCASTKQ